MLNNGPISWCSQKQNCVSLSTTESEYIAASKATKEAIWLRQLLREFHQEQVKPTTIFCDNQSCIRLVHNPEYRKRTKHIDISYHFIRDQFQKHAIDLLYVCSNDQAADIFTKALPPERYRRLRSQLGLFETTKCSSVITYQTINKAIPQCHLKVSKATISEGRKLIKILQSAVTIYIEDFKTYLHRRTLKIPWTDMVTNNQVLDQMGTELQLIKFIKQRTLAGHVISSCRAVRPLLREVFASCEVPLDLQAWLFGVGLHPEAVKPTRVVIRGVQGVAETGSMVLSQGVTVESRQTAMLKSKVWGKKVGLQLQGNDPCVRGQMPKMAFQCGGKQTFWGHLRRVEDAEIEKSSSVVRNKEDTEAESKGDRIHHSEAQRKGDEVKDPQTAIKGNESVNNSRATSENAEEVKDSEEETKASEFEDSKEAGEVKYSRTDKAKVGKKVIGTIAGYLPQLK
ncbi:hypothetical protein LAZ67_16002904 [Cordylochernes scorpioides]|uniref:Copia protein n=1 Tax=Cordylochernes scorpioides TaxID=51811 RepID=A0ABY6LCB7_9ARAC|nr:hypothetical protein LAZ67_16002904 [Cordylochernes scorpioides]